MAGLGTVKIPAAQLLEKQKVRVIITGVTVLNWRMNLGAWLIAWACRLAGFPKVELLIVDSETQR